MHFVCACVQFFFIQFKTAVRAQEDCLWYVYMYVAVLLTGQSASSAKDPGFKSCLRRDFSGVESYQ